MKLFLFRLIPPRPSFLFDMTPPEQAVMARHAGYWRALAQDGDALLAGPVGDPAGAWGVGIIEAADQSAADAMLAADPALTGRIGMRAELFPILSSIVSPRISPRGF